MGSFNYDSKSGIISAGFMNGGNNSYNANVDIKAFLKELHATLFDMGFKDYGEKDNVRVKHFKPTGEEPQASDLKRTCDMYETKFVWLEKSAGQFEVEFHWFASRPSEMFGDDAMISFKLNLVNRAMTNKEFVQGDNKQVLQTGNWEHRNKLEYTNYAISNKKKKFEKIPLVPTQFIMDLHAHMFMKNNIEHDIYLIDKKINAKLAGLIRKHFSSLD